MNIISYILEAISSISLIIGCIFCYLHNFQNASILLGFSAIGFCETIFAKVELINNLKKENQELKKIEKEKGQKSPKNSKKLISSGLFNALYKKDKKDKKDKKVKND